MKKLLFYIAAMAIAVGCNDMTEEIDTPDSLTPSSELVSVSLNLTPEGSDNKSRVSINEYYETEWVDGETVYAVLITGEDSAYKYTKLTYSSETELFSGEIYVGENRIYTSMTTGTNITAPIIDYTNGTYKMVSKDTITITGEAETSTEEIDVYMQNIGAIFNFDITFINNTSDDWSNVYVQDITFGDSSDESSIDYVTGIELDPSKGVEEDGFVTKSLYDDSYTNGSKILESDSDGKYTYDIMTNPFTIANGEKLKVKITLMVDGYAGAGNPETITTYIENNSGEDFVFGRSTYSTITKTIDLNNLD